MTALLSLLLLAAPAGAEKGKGVLVDERGNRVEITGRSSSGPALPRLELPSVDVGNGTPKQRLRRAYAWLLGTAVIAFCLVYIARRAGD